MGKQGIKGYLNDASGKEPAWQSRRHRDVGLNPGSGRSLGGGNGNPLQYSYLENPMNREARWTTVHEVAKSRTLLSDWHLPIWDIEYMNKMWKKSLRRNEAIILEFPPIFNFEKCSGGLETSLPQETLKRSPKITKGNVTSFMIRKLMIQLLLSGSYQFSFNPEIKKWQANWWLQENLTLATI